MSELEFGFEDAKESGLDYVYERDILKWSGDETRQGRKQNEGIMVLIVQGTL